MTQMVFNHPRTVIGTSAMHRNNGKYTNGRTKTVMKWKDLGAHKQENVTSTRKKAGSNKRWKDVLKKATHLSAHT